MVMATYPRFSEGSWRRATCLGCCELVKRNRDSWVEFGGTRSGSWTVAMGVDPGLGFADELPCRQDEELVLLGVSHKSCLLLARDRIRSGYWKFDDHLPVVFVENIPSVNRLPDLGKPRPVDGCPFCSYRGFDLTDEDVYPKWLRKELQRRGAKFSANGYPTRRAPKVTIPVCEDCNNTWMSVLENDTNDLLISLIDNTRLIGRDEQEKLAFWAAKTALLLSEVKECVVPHGFGQELRVNKRPSRNCYVWIAASNGGEDALAVHRRYIMFEHEEKILGLCVTFAVVRVVFQVYIPFYSGTLGPLEDFNESVLPIWPVQFSTIDWPPPFYFNNDGFSALAVRIYDNREPVTMNVTLTEAVRRRPSG